MHFPTLLTLVFTSLVAATPYPGQYDFPVNETIPSLPAETYVAPSSAPTNPAPAARGSGYNLPRLNSTTTAQAVAHPTGTGAPRSSSTLVPFMGASAPVKEASLALVALAGVIVVCL